MRRIAVGAGIALLGIGLMAGGLWIAGLCLWYLGQPASGATSYGLHAMAFGGMAVSAAIAITAPLAAIPAGFSWAFEP